MERESDYPRLRAPRPLADRPEPIDVLMRGREQLNSNYGCDERLNRAKPAAAALAADAQRPRRCRRARAATGSDAKFDSCPWAGSHPIRWPASGRRGSDWLSSAAA